MTQVADAFVRYLADTKDLLKALGPGGPVDKAAETNAKTVGSRFKTAFTASTTGLGIVAGGAFAGALELGSKLEDQMRTVNTVAGLTDGELAGLTDGVQSLSRETGATTDDLTAGLYDLVSAGIPAGQALDVLRNSAKLGIGALGSTGEAVDAVTSALNAYGLGADQSARVTDILAKAVQDGKVNISQIGGTIANIAPVAAAAGISLEEVSAGFAVLTAKGTPAAQAATQMRAAISALLTPNEQLNAIQKETGINFAELAKAKGLSVALDELRKATGGNDEAFAKALGSIEGYQFALQSTGDNAETFQAQIQETLGAAGIANTQYEEKSKSALEQGKRMFASVATFAQDVGGPFVGSLGAGAFALNELARTFGIPINPAKVLGATIGGIGGRVIPMLIGGLASILPAITPALGALVSGAGAVLTAALAAWPLLLLAAVVAAVIFLINNPEIVAQIGVFIGSVLDAISAFLGALPQLLLDLFSAAFAAVVAAAPGFIGAVAGIILTLPFRILDLQVKLLEFVAGILTNILGGFTNLVVMIRDVLFQLPGFFAEVAANIIGGVADLVRAIVGALFSLPGQLVELGGKIVGSIIDGMASLPGRIFDTIANAFRNLRIDIGPFHISASGVSIDLPHIDLPSFDVGASFVPADMLAMVHRGEMILTADEASAIRSGRLSLGRPTAGASSTPIATGGSTTIVQVEGLVRAEDPDDIGRVLRRIASVGQLPDTLPRGPG